MAKRLWVALLLASAAVSSLAAVAILDGSAPTAHDGATTVAANKTPVHEHAVLVSTNKRVSTPNAHRPGPQLGLLAAVSAVLLALLGLPWARPRLCAGVAASVFFRRRGPPLLQSAR